MEHQKKEGTRWSRKWRRVRGEVGRMWVAWLSWFYPWRCELCGALGECLEHCLPSGVDSGRCTRCAVRLPVGVLAAAACGACRGTTVGWSSMVVLGSYGFREPLRPWLLAFKHGSRSDLAFPLGSALARQWVTRFPELDPESNLLVPVPVHRLRKWLRGYDQAVLLGEQVARVTGIRLMEVLFRSRSTQAQGSLYSGSRGANVRGAFGVHPEEAPHLAGRTIWLVDDVCTSGATLRACARALRNAGALRVSVVCLARVEPRG